MLALLAVAVLAWLVIVERDLRLEVRGIREGGHNKLAQAHHDLHRAGLLNPDSTPQLVEATLYSGRGQRPLALSSVNGVLRAEPKNLGAWTTLLLVAGANDDADRTRGLAAVQRLDPIDFKLGER